MLEEGVGMKGGLNLPALCGEVENTEVSEEDENECKEAEPGYEEDDG